MSEEANPSRVPKSRPLRYWQQFNSWWRSELERKGVRPSGNDIGRWYSAESDAAWGTMAKPSLEDTRSHAKSLRSVTSVREYFREYRTKKKHEGDGDDNDLLLSCQRSSDGRGRSRESSGTGALAAAIQTFNASTSSSQQPQHHNPRGSTGASKRKGSNAGGRARANKHSLAEKPPPHAALQCSSSLPAATRQKQGTSSSHRSQFAIHPGALTPSSGPGDALLQPAQAAAAAAAAQGATVMAWPGGAAMAAGGFNGGLPAGFDQHGQALGLRHSFDLGADGSGLQGQQPWVQEQQQGHAHAMQGGCLTAAQHPSSLAVEQPPAPAAYSHAAMQQQQQQQQQQHLLQGPPPPPQQQGQQQGQHHGKQQQLQQWGAAAYSLQPGTCPSSQQQQQQQLQQAPYQWLDQQQWQPQWQWHHPASMPGVAQQQQQQQPGLSCAAPAAAQQLEHTQQPYAGSAQASGCYSGMRFSDNTAVTVNDVVPPPPAPAGAWQQPAGMQQHQHQQQLPPLRVSTFLDGTPFGEAARRLSQAQALDQLALPQAQQQQRLSLYALSSDALDIFGKDGLEGLDLDAFLGTLPCGPGGGPGSPGGGCGGQAGEFVAPIAPGSRTTVLLRPALELPDHWLQSAMATAFGGCPPHHNPAALGAEVAALADLVLPSTGTGTAAGMQLPPVAPGSLSAAAGGEERAARGGGGGFAVPVLDLSGGCCKRSRSSGLLPDDRVFKVPASLVSPGACGSGTPARSKAAAAVAALTAGPAFSALAAAAGRGGQGANSSCSQSPGVQPGGGRRSGNAGRAGGCASSAQGAAAVACGGSGGGESGGAGAGASGDCGAARTLTPASTAAYKCVLNLADSSDDLPFPFAQPTPQPQPQQHEQGQQEREGAPSPLRISTRQLDALPLPQQQAWLDPALLLQEEPWDVSPTVSPAQEDRGCSQAGAQAAAGLFGGTRATSHDGWQWQQPQQLWQGQQPQHQRHACPSSSNPLQAAGGVPGAGQSRRPLLILNLADDASAPLPPDAFAAAAAGTTAGAAAAAEVAGAAGLSAAAAHGGLQKGFLPAMHEIESMI